MIEQLEKFGEAMAVVATLRNYAIEGGYAHLGMATATISAGYEPRHWAARVAADRSEKSGLRREWLPKGQSGWYAVSRDLVGEVVEVGCSGFDSRKQQQRGNRTSATRYRQVIAVAETRMLTRVVDEADVRANRVGPAPSLEPATTEEPSPLAEVSTEDLVAELRRRGIGIKEVAS